MPTASHSLVARRLLQLAEDIDRLGFAPDAKILTAMAELVLSRQSLNMVGS